MRMRIFVAMFGILLFSCDRFFDFPTIQLPYEPSSPGSILFVGEYQGGRWFYTMNVDGSDIRPLCPAGDRHYPQWSPDGLHIAFTEYYCDPGHRCDPIPSAVVVMLWDGSMMCKISDDYSDSPVWSPDGSQIAYRASYFASYAIETAPDGREREVYQADRSGTGIVIADMDGSDAYLAIKDRYEILDWSPNGELLLVGVRREWNGVDFDHFECYSVDGVKSLVLRVEGHDISDGKFSPDGNRVAFTIQTGEYDHYHEVALMNLDGSDLRVIPTANSHSNRLICWSPGGERLLVWSGESIYLLAIATGEMQNISPAGFTHFEFSSWRKCDLDP